MKLQRYVGGRRWRIVLLLMAGVVIGSLLSLLSAAPVSSHVGGTFAHLWNQHIRPRADQRYLPRVEARSRYVRVAFATTPTNVTDGFQMFFPDQLHGVSVLNDSDLDEESDVIIANEGTIDILVLAPGGPYTLAPDDLVEISGADPSSLQAVITPVGQTPQWSIYLWCGFNPELTGTPAQARCMTLNGNDNLEG